MKKEEKKKKRKVRLSGLIFLILFGYLLYMIGYHIWKLPVKNIVIEGINILEEKDIIESLDLQENVSFLSINSQKLAKKLEQHDFIKKVSIKKTDFGVLNIVVEENKILFFSYLDNKYVLSDGTKVEDNASYLGYPTLVNYVPSEVYNKLINSLAKIDRNILSMISEIEYDPDEYNDVVIDSERFMLRMNDYNKVYINTINIDKLNNYMTIVATIKENGVLYLDSGSENYIFKTNSVEGGGNEN